MMDNPPKVLYLCDRRQCQNCSYPECKYTTDIIHAVNFVSDGQGGFVEVRNDDGQPDRGA